MITTYIISQQKMLPIEFVGEKDPKGFKNALWSKPKIQVNVNSNNGLLFSLLNMLMKDLYYICSKKAQNICQSCQKYQLVAPVHSEIVSQAV